MRVVFMGTPEFSVPTLQALLDSEYDVVGVVTQPDRPRGRGKAVSPSPVKVLALAHDVPILQPDKMKAPEFLDALKAWRPEVIVVAAFGRILPQIILDLPPRGCVNVHSSLLPKYRGAAPIQWAIIRGEEETGITTMLMDAGMDTGDILLQEALAIETEETAGELSERLAAVGGDLLLMTLRLWLAEDIIPQPQRSHLATMAPMLKKDDGLLDWNDRAVALCHRVRGLSPWPGAYTFHGEHRLAIWRAAPLTESNPSQRDAETHAPGTVVRANKHGIVVQTGDGYVNILELQSANRKRLPVEQFLAGSPISAGDTFTIGPVERQL